MAIKPRSLSRYVHLGNVVLSAVVKPPEDRKSQWPEQHPDNLVLRFGTALKNPDLGWVFGSSTEKCDVLLQTPKGDANEKGISKAHFSITIDERYRVVLRDRSSWGTAVGYDGQADQEVRQHVAWILCQNGNQAWDETFINVPNTDGFRFQIFFPNHHKGNKEYNENVQNYLRRPREPAFQQLSVKSEPITRQMSRPKTPDQRPVYVPQGLVGDGAYGDVYKAMDAGSGEIFARKLIKSSATSPKDLKTFLMEVQMLQENVHPNIAEIVEFEASPRMCITMKFYAYGSLRKTSPQYPWDQRDVFRQILTGLSFLHRRKIVHRDLKPDNILVKSIEPFEIVLADFGYARYFDSRVASSGIGTAGYMAPEVFLGNYYGPPVDIY
ncbi:kinase-like domain-containing protein [Phyllosticta citricarpa]